MTQFSQSNIKYVATLFVATATKYTRHCNQSQRPPAQTKIQLKKWQQYQHPFSGVTTNSNKNAHGTATKDCQYHRNGLYNVHQKKKYKRASTPWSLFTGRRRVSPHCPGFVANSPSLGGHSVAIFCQSSPLNRSAVPPKIHS